MPTDFRHSFTRPRLARYLIERRHERQFEADENVIVFNHNAVASSVTGTTGQTTLRTITLPARLIPRMGGVRITGLFSYTNSANNKTIRCTFGGTAVFAQIATATAAHRFQHTVSARNLLNSEVSAPNGLTGGWGSTTGSLVTPAVDLTASVDIVFTGQLALGTEQIALEYSVVELINFDPHFVKGLT